MRVMCVETFNGQKLDSNPTYPNIILPHAGSEYIVTKLVKRYGMLMYKLAEYDQTMNFDARQFAILPDQTADEMQELEKEAILL